MKNGKIFISKVLILYYIKLFFRAALFIAASTLYIINKINRTGKYFGAADDMPILIFALWLICALDISVRFFPHKTEDVGCQKHFKCNNISGNKNPRKIPWQKTLICALAWIFPNSIMAILFFAGILDVGIMIIITLAYSVCDMICILFFCPFHTWIMKNKCCGTCRIYNWDYAMMFTPLIFIPNIFARGLVLISLLLLIRWEVTYKLHPERFTENTNQSLECANCKEKLCHHKVQLKTYLRKWKREERKKRRQAE